MKTDLDHLPENKQRYVMSIRDLILDEVERFVDAGGKNGKRQLNKIKYIILFGSYCRGTYVDDPDNGYVSDYDILVVMNRNELIEEYDLWRNIEEKAERRVHSPVTLIIHTMSDVGQRLSEGQYFFSDIQKEGICLYGLNNQGLPTPKTLTDAERKPIAEEHFGDAFQSANGFLDTFNYVKGQGRLKESAFLLHQATERYYNTLLLVVSNYRPKIHAIDRLHSMAANYAPDVQCVFGRDNRFKKRSFSRLKRAYVDARYSKHYEITEEELEWLTGQVEQLRQIVEQHCLDHIASL